MSEFRRRTGARVGICVLNLAAPGLGLLRAHRLRAALIFLALPLLMLILLVFVLAFFGPLSFGGWAITNLSAIALILFAWVGSIVLSWRASRDYTAARAWWSHWYSLVAVYVLVTVIAWPIAGLARSYQRSFYLPSDGMAPTLRKSDRFVADMRAGDLHRGDIVVFSVNGAEYVKRIAGLPGDRIALVGGEVVVNGRPVPQRFLHNDRVEGFAGRQEARRMLELFPGEQRPHEIFDLGSFYLDDMPTVRVPAAHLFVLGDNRDESADSRVERNEGGVGLVPVADVVGIPQFIYWRSDAGVTNIPLARD